MKKIYVVVRGFKFNMENDSKYECCELYEVKCGCNELNVFKSIFKYYSTITQMFTFTTYKEASNVKRQIENVL